MIIYGPELQQTDPRKPKGPELKKKRRRSKILTRFKSGTSLCNSLDPIKFGLGLGPGSCPRTHIPNVSIFHVYMLTYVE